MKCPACFNELTQVKVGQLTLDVCQEGCGGVWFDAFELKHADEHGEAGDPLLRITKDPRVTVDFNRKRNCPRCEDVKLHRHFFSAKRKVQVDHCPNCAGYWLDAGELAQIRAEKAEDHIERVQEGCVSSEVIRYIYQLSTNA